MWVRTFSLLLTGLICTGGVSIAFAVESETDLNPLGASSRSMRTSSFQNGVNGYSGTVDTEIWALAPATILSDNPNASTDADNDGGESQVLLRFDSVFGDGKDQVPLGSRVVAARFYVSAFDQGTTVNLHRLKVPFSKTATWNSMVDGVSADGDEASRHKDSFTFGKIAANSSTVIFDVTDTIQYWASGHPAHGWVFLNTGGNGWDFYASEFEDIQQRPRLEIDFVVPCDDQIQIQDNNKGTENAKTSND